MLNKKQKKLRLVRDFAMILLGTVLMGFAFSIFLEPNNISTGGFSGLSMIINALLNLIGIYFLNTSIIYFVLNIGLFLYAFKTLGKKFAIKALAGIVFFSLAMEVCGLISISFTFEPLISAIYGGILMGLGIGLVVRFGGSTGGGDMIASIIRSKKPKFSIGMIVIIIDIIVILLSLFVFSNGLEVMPYTIIALAICSVVTDFVNDGYKQVRAYHIITEKGDQISKRIMNELYRGCTLTKAEGMHSHVEKDYLICLISKFQAGLLIKIVKSEDKNAFVYSTKVTEVLGYWTSIEEIDIENEKKEDELLKNSNNLNNQYDVNLANKIVDNSDKKTKDALNKHLGKKDNKRLK